MQLGGSANSVADLQEQTDAFGRDLASGLDGSHKVDRGSEIAGRCDDQHVASTRIYYRARRRRCDPNIEGSAGVRTQHRGVNGPHRHWSPLEPDNNGVARQRVVRPLLL